jgi:hypothetical protein
MLIRAVDILVWVVFVAVVVTMLLIGGKALRFNLRLRMRPFQPKYRGDRDGGEGDRS